MLARAGKLIWPHEGAEVTIPRRTDHGSGDSSNTSRVKILAELPHVGSAPVPVPEKRASSETVRVAERKPKSNHPAFADYDDSEDDYPTAKPVLQRHSSRYVDQPHTDHEWEDEDHREWESYAPRSRRVMASSRSTRRSQSQRSGNWRPVLSEAHSQLAPFAGLIVTAALVTAAVFLFLIVAGRRQPGTGLENFALPSDGFRVELEEELPAEENSTVAPLVDAGSGIIEQPPQEMSTGAVPETPSAELSLENQANDSSAINLVPDEIKTTTLAPLGELTFPITTTPLALDYSKAVGPPTDDLQALPAVAERENPSTEPINR